LAVPKLPKVGSSNICFEISFFPSPRLLLSPSYSS
jgi:hypothetical protein